MIAQHFTERDRLTHGGPQQKLVRTDQPAHPLQPALGNQRTVDEHQHDRKQRRFTRRSDHISQLSAAELGEFNGEDDHVHLLVHHPPKVQLSNLVNSLKAPPPDTCARTSPDAATGRSCATGSCPRPTSQVCGGASSSSTSSSRNARSAPTRSHSRPARRPGFPAKMEGDDRARPDHAEEEPHGTTRAERPAAAAPRTPALRAVGGGRRS
ncbi:transposase [Streptomyces sp. NPDC050255]|uniref:transposase n=1 Tax=Streptomyces sp. NPDC050255 TaxID=3365606 RepID=UPI0037B3103C